MDPFISEINKHKNNINDLSKKLLTTVNLNEEISLNNEIKKEVEFLSSLFNIREQLMTNPNNMNYLINQNENIDNNDRLIAITFVKADENNTMVTVQCKMSEKFSVAIQRYKIKSYDLDVNEENKYIFNAEILSKDLTISEAGFKDGCRITVVKQNIIG